MSANNRRTFIKNTIAGAGFLSLPSLLQAQAGAKINQRKIVCVGGHPDDPETGCGGTLARLANAGHDITIIYLTQGEGGIRGSSHAEAAAVRKQEAINACRVLKARPVFAGQTDGETIVNNEWINKIQALLEAEQPDIVFAHWPVDTHPDHQAASLLTIQAWRKMQQKFSLYFFEVLTGDQTMIFHPTDYVDISDTQEQKRKAVYCHTSQHPDKIYSRGHAAMEIFRGQELGVKAGEAFVRMNGKQQGGLIIS
ncbi:PIG-L deacetylase family protein [Chitinophaga sp. MM2321]|uniref:PIG-L deacetylase family protein n=1 Tax=Chitinophaga sp. MM2321 TaxID=3137178 RepID=UPI0032D57380